MFMYMSLDDYKIHNFTLFKSITYLPVDYSQSFLTQIRDY